MPAYERAACLRRVADGLDARRETFATLLARDVHDPGIGAGRGQPVGHGLPFGQRQHQAGKPAQ